MAIQIFERQNPYPQIMSELYRIASARNTAKDEMRMRGEEMAMREREAVAAREFQAAENLAMRKFQEGRDKINADFQTNLAEVGYKKAAALAQEQTRALEIQTNRILSQMELGQKAESERHRVMFGGYSDTPMGPPTEDGAMGAPVWEPGFYERMGDKRESLFKSLIEMGTPKVDAEDPSTIPINIPAHIRSDFIDAGVDMPETVYAGDLPYYINKLQPDALDYLGSAVATTAGGLVGGGAGFLAGGGVGAVPGFAAGMHAANAFLPTDLSQKRALREGPAVKRLNELMTIAENEAQRRGQQFSEEQRLNMVAALAPMIMSQPQYGQ